MIACDTSVVVAAFSPWHHGHFSATKAIGSEARLPAQVLVESYSVLTRLPPPHRAPAAVVAEFLGKRFPAPPLSLPPREHSRFIQEMAEIEIVGGSVYDALIAAQAKKAGATLVSRDVQAAVVYEAVGVRFELIA